MEGSNTPSNRQTKTVVSGSRYEYKRSEYVFDSEKYDELIKTLQSNRSSMEPEIPQPPISDISIESRHRNNSISDDSASEINIRQRKHTPSRKTQNRNNSSRTEESASYISYTSPIINENISYSDSEGEEIDKSQPQLKNISPIPKATEVDSGATPSSSTTKGRRNTKSLSSSINRRKGKRGSNKNNNSVTNDRVNSIEMEEEEDIEDNNRDENISLPLPPTPRVENNSMEEDDNEIEEEQTTSSTTMRNSKNKGNKRGSKTNKRNSIKKNLSTEFNDVAKDIDDNNNDINYENDFDDILTSSSPNTSFSSSSNNNNRRKRNSSNDNDKSTKNKTPNSLKTKKTSSKTTTPTPQSSKKSNSNRNILNNANDNDYNNSSKKNKKNSDRLYMSYSSFVLDDSSITNGIDDNDASDNDYTMSRINDDEDDDDNDDNNNSSIVTANEDDSIRDSDKLVLRRTPRKRFKPLKYWEGEHLFISKKETKKVKYGAEIPEKKKRKIERNNNKVKRQRVKYEEEEEECEYPSDVEEDDIDHFTLTTTRIDNKTKKKVVDNERIRFIGDENNIRNMYEGISVDSTIKDKNTFCQCILKIKPKEKKKEEKTALGPTLMGIFSCQKNSLVMSIGNKKYLLKERNTVYVPVNVPYSIENRSEKQEAVIHFILINKEE